MWVSLSESVRSVSLEKIQVYLSSLLALFQVLIAVFLHALHVCVSDEMGAFSHRAAFRQRDEGRLVSLSLWCLWTCSSFIVLWLTGQQLKNDTLIVCLIQADCIIPVVVLINMSWWEWPLKGYQASKRNNPHHIISDSWVTHRERESNGNLISSQLEPLPHNEIWKGILRALFIIFFEIAGFWHRKFNSSGSG